MTAARLGRGALAVLLAACQPTSEPVVVEAPVADAGPDLVALVGEPITLDASGSQHATEARWTFGDGDSTERGPGLTAPHTYERPGHYVATVEVFGADGRPTTDSVRVTVTWPALPTPPSAASAVVGAQGLVFAVMPDFDLVAVVSEATGEVVDHLTGCAHPRRIAAAERPNASLIAVSCEEEQPAIALYDVRGGVISDHGFVELSSRGWSPFGVAMTSDGDIWFTARERSSDLGILAHLDSNGALVETLRVGADLRGLAIEGDDLWVSQHRSPDDGGRMWHVQLNGDAREEHVVPVAPGPDSDTNSRGVPSYLETLVIRPDGRTGVIGGLKANIQRGLVRDGLELTDETTVRADLRQFAARAAEGAVGEELASARLDNRDRIAAAAWLPRGDWLYLAVSGVGVIDVFDSYTFERANTVLDVGTAPEGLWVSPDGATLYALTSLHRELVAYDLTDPATPVERERIDLRPGGVDVLDPDVLAGKEIFHRSGDPRMSLDGYVSCASCHLDGEGDNRTWDFTQRGEGLRNTITLRGFRDHADGPIHWSANFDELQDFEGDIRNAQGGLGFLTDALWASAVGPSLGAPKAGLSTELDQLAAYIRTLGPIELPAMPVDPYGAQLFAQVGCGDCHPDGGTDSRWLAPGQPLLHDVGTLTELSGSRLGGELTGLDAPDLRGVWATPPYLHDGSAATLEQVLDDRNFRNQHGDIAAFGGNPRAALAAYLRTL